MINFGDKSLIVDYLQTFLKEHFNKSLISTGIYDYDTHFNLIQFLKKPEIISNIDMKRLIINEFTFKDINPPHMLINGGGIYNFSFKITDDSILFYSKPINECYNNAYLFLSNYKNNIDSFCKKYGWYLQNYNVTDLKSIEFVIKKSGIQILPNSDILKMINLNLNKILNNRCFVDENNSYHGFIQNSNKYKIYYIPANSNETYTICHRYDDSLNISIGYIDYFIHEIDSFGYVKNICNYKCDSIDSLVLSNKYSTYTIPNDSNCKYLLIQIPINDNLSYLESNELLILFGDILENNSDNKLNFPISEFKDTPWLIHDEFIPYLLQHNIHKYSNINDICWLQNIIKNLIPQYNNIVNGKYDDELDYISNEKFIWNNSKNKYEYFINGSFTGLILDNDLYKSNLINENDMSNTDIQILNGRWFKNKELINNKLILKDGTILKGDYTYCLKNIIKNIQINYNKNIKNTEKIKFINGNIDALTEKILINLLNK